MSVRSPKKAPHPERVSRYQILDVIGVGGMGTVYRARDPHTDAVVAVKVLTANLADDPTLYDRFDLEFRAAAKLEHPNIVRALDFGVDRRVSFLVTELVHGTNLARMVEAGGPLPEEVAVRIATQVAQALHYAHEHNVIHRDVKPDNVLVRSDGVAKLADFGLAKDADDDRGLTRTKSGLGTPHFMAPEQYADAKRVGPACDVYALGATLYAAVTGRVPFDGCASLIALSRKVKGDIPSARQLAPGLSERVDAAIRRAMNPLPDRRPGSCLEFFKLLTARPRTARTGKRNLKEEALAGPTDRRIYARHAVGAGSSCVVDTALHGGVPSTREAWPVVVRDVSAGGIGVLMARRFEPGTELLIELVAGPHGRPRTLPARVVRVSRADHGHWVLGCEFAAPLGEKELAEVVEQVSYLDVKPG